MRITVRDLDGTKISFGRALFRNILKLLTIVSIIGIFLPFFTSRKQALHDIIAFTVVLKRDTRSN